jgi:hypothetical protein
MKTPLEVPNAFSLATYLPFSGPVNQAIATSWLTRAMRQIEEIKTSIPQSAVGDAREALDRLREHAPEDLAPLLKEEAGRGPDKA